MKRSVCLLMIGAFVLGVSGCSYHVTWGKNGVRELRLSMLNGKKIRLAQQLNMLTKLSQLSRLKEQAISSSIFARLNMLRGL